MPVILITGASRGIGQACVEWLLNKDCAVVTLSRSPIKIKHADIREVTGDVSNASDCQKAVDTAIAEFGQLNGLILNAGTLDPFQRIAEIDLDQLEQSFKTNVLSCFTLTKLAIPQLRKTKGRVIAVSSGASQAAYAGWAAYGATKAAMNHFITSLAIEEPDITAVSIRPGTVDTDMQKLLRDQGSAHMEQKVHQHFLDLHKNAALLPPERPAACIASLAVNADTSLSGKYLSWDDSTLQAYK